MITSVCKVLLIILLLEISLTFVNSNSIDENGFLKLFDSHERTLYFGDEKFPEFEIVYLPSELSNGRRQGVTSEDEDERKREIYFNFEAFNEDIELFLSPNLNLISPYTTIIKTSQNEERIHLRKNYSAINCHFLTQDKSKSSAAVSNCNKDEISGLIFLPSSTLEILPLPERLRDVYRIKLESKNGNMVSKVPHIVKKVNFTQSFGDDEYIPGTSRNFESVKKFRENSSPNVEIGLFFDESFYQTYSPFFNDDNDRMMNFILSYMNGIQSLYYHKSLKRKIDFTIVHLEIMTTQPETLPHHYGERNGLIDSFCSYQKRLNPRDDRHPQHWDISLYVSSLDFFSWGEYGRKNLGTMGYATVGGACNLDFNCVIAEFGVTNQNGRPYPSTGFASIFIAAHEIAHNLGMSHDSVGNSCSKEGFVMSPTRGFEGEAAWSECSATSARDLEWAKCLFDRSPTISEDWELDEYPGSKISTKKQCEILTRDQNSFPIANNALSSICNNLHCRTTSSSEVFFGGPALSGTSCGEDRWCDGGACVKKDSNPDDFYDEVEEDEEIQGKCESPCLVGGKGIEELKIEGKSIFFANKKLCDDQSICKTRRSVLSYGSEKCQEFSKKVDQIDPNGYGLQGSFSSTKVWMACAVYCKRKNSSIYFSPRFELNEFGINPYFPDGTLCHRVGNLNYYCIKAHCLPEY